MLKFTRSVLLFLLIIISSEGKAIDLIQRDSNKFELGVRVPIHVEDKHMLIRAKINSEEGWFILDTGVSDLILDRDIFGAGQSGNPITALSGEAIVSEAKVVSLKLGKLKRKFIRATLINLGHLQVNGKKILGLIGNGFLKKYTLIFDYGAGYVLFLTKREAPVFLEEQMPYEVFPFTFLGHLPCLKTTIGTNDFLFGLDSGASISLFTKDRRDQVKKHLSQCRPVRIRNIGPQAVTAMTMIIDDVQVGSFPAFSLRFAFVPFDHFNSDLSGPPIQGILGSEFLCQRKIAINFTEQKIYIWENHNDQQQWLLASGSN